MNAVLNSNFLHLFSALSKDFEQRVVSTIQHDGHPKIRPAHITLFSLLGREHLRLTELAERAHISQQAMGKLVKELASLHYLQRQSDQDDKRAKIISVTEKGSALITIMNQAIISTTSSYVDTLGQEDATALSKQLENTVDKLGIEYPTPSKTLYSK